MQMSLMRMMPMYGPMSIERLNRIQKEVPTSILHLTLDTDRRTQGALSGVMRIGFDFDIVDNWIHRG